MAKVEQVFATSIYSAPIGGGRVKPFLDELKIACRAIEAEDAAGHRWSEEAGYKGLVLDAWYAAFVPKGTRPAIVARLNKEMNDALKDPKLLQNFIAGAVEPMGGTPEEIGKIAQADSVKYARLVKEFNIRAN